jgi:hypothetical protein
MPVGGGSLYSVLNQSPYGFGFGTEPAAITFKYAEGTTTSGGNSTNDLRKKLPETNRPK